MVFREKEWQHFIWGICPCNSYLEEPNFSPPATTGENLLFQPLSPACASHGGNITGFILSLRGRAEGTSSSPNLQITPVPETVVGLINRPVLLNILWNTACFYKAGSVLSVCSECWGGQVLPHALAPGLSLRFRCPPRLLSHRKLSPA